MTGSEYLSTSFTENVAEALVKIVLPQAVRLSSGIVMAPIAKGGRDTYIGNHWLDAARYFLAPALLRLNEQDDEDADDDLGSISAASKENVWGEVEARNFVLEHYPQAIQRARYGTIARTPSDSANVLGDSWPMAARLISERAITLIGFSENMEKPELNPTAEDLKRAHALEHLDKLSPERVVAVLRELTAYFYAAERYIRERDL